MFDYSIIQNLLNARNLEAKDLAEKIGVYPPRLSDWKSGRLKSPSIDNLEKIADYFNVSVDYLLGRVSDYPVSDAEAVRAKKRSQIFDFSDMNNFSRLIPIFNKSISNFLDTPAQRVADAYGRATLREQKIVDYALEPYFKQQAEIVELPKREKRLSQMPASAGTGAFLNEEQFDVVEVGDEVPDVAEYGVPIFGDSMEPDYPAGWIAWVQLAVDLRVGDVGVFGYDGDGYIKKWGGDRLISLNEKYPPIVLEPGARFDVFGRVVAVTENIYK
jgi:phage repressor protein C with HTH and peptisase S24 domain/DNA-binding Xre family transcriptional regulator